MFIGDKCITRYSSMRYEFNCGLLKFNEKVKTCRVCAADRLIIIIMLIAVCWGASHSVRVSESRLS